MEDTVTSLRERAAQARRLSKAIGDPEARRTLSQMADELDEAADELAEGGS